MRHTTLGLVAIVLQLLAVACAGVRARETALMPVMAKAWSTVVAGAVESGVVAGKLPAEQTAEQVRAASTAMQQALDSGDRYSVRAVDWTSLRQVALDGIAARAALPASGGGIGGGVAMSLVETVNEFDRNHTKLLLR